MPHAPREVGKRPRFTCVIREGSNPPPDVVHRVFMRVGAYLLSSLKMMIFALESAEVQVGMGSFSFMEIMGVNLFSSAPRIRPATDHGLISQPRTCCAPARR